MAVYMYLPHFPEKFTSKDANVTVLGLIVPRVGNVEVFGKDQRGCSMITRPSPELLELLV